jgi:hypothetical protein
MRPIADPTTLNRLFVGYTEHALIGELGVTDTRLVDYVAGLLGRFLHRDQIFSLPAPVGRQVFALSEMVHELERSPAVGPERRELFRHIGDFALFWSGMFPEAVQHHRAVATGIEEVTGQGKRSYFLASTYRDLPAHADEAPLLRQLSDEFEICATGLRRARDLWQADQSESVGPG